MCKQLRPPVHWRNEIVFIRRTQAVVVSIIMLFMRGTQRGMLCNCARTHWTNGRLRRHSTSNLTSWIYIQSIYLVHASNAMGENGIVWAPLWKYDKHFICVMNIQSAFQFKYISLIRCCTRFGADELWWALLTFHFPRKNLDSCCKSIALIRRVKPHQKHSSLHCQFFEIPTKISSRLTDFTHNLFAKYFTRAFGCRNQEHLQDNECECGTHSQAVSILCSSWALARALTNYAYVIPSNGWSNEEEVIGGDGTAEKWKLLHRSRS